MLLDSGVIKFQGNVDEAILVYNSRDTNGLTYENNKGGKDVYLQKIELTNSRGEVVNQFFHNEEIYLNVAAHCKIPSQAVKLGIALLNNYQQRVFTIEEPLSKGRATGNLYEMTIRLEPGMIVPNHYQFYFDLFIPHQAIFDSVVGHFPIRIADGGSIFAGYEGEEYGYFFMKHEVIN
jgi:hypothetical protein